MEAPFSRRFCAPIIGISPVTAFGIFRDQGRSGVVLTGSSPTTVSEIMAWRAEPPPRLVYLSACSTNFINVERDLNAFVGLNTAFLSSGASRVIGAQWAVNDVASALLAARFYQELLRQRRSPPAALRAAQNWLKRASSVELAGFVQTLLETGVLVEADGDAILGQLVDLSGDAPPYSNPYFWVGFQLFGS